MAEVTPERTPSPGTDLLVVTDDRFALHAPEAHPESPARLAWAWEGVSAAADALGLTVRRVAPADDRPVDLEQLAASVHSRQHLDRLKEVSARGGGMLSLDTAMSAESYRVALLAASAASRAAELCRTERLPALALVRPPGHHAGRSSGTGFCLLNNIAVAARRAQAAGGGRRTPIALVDWDVHHGNGTDEIFCSDGDVLYVSMHEFPLYPYSGWTAECGHGPGEGRTVNLPLPGGLTDSQALEAFRRVVAPVVEAFRPAQILVSAGQDGHWQDPMSSWRLTARGYAEMARELADIALRSGLPPPAAVLEGGYSPWGMKASFAGIAAALTGRGLPPPAEKDGASVPEAGPRQKDEFSRRLEEIVALQARFWPVS